MLSCVNDYTAVIVVPKFLASISVIDTANATEECIFHRSSVLR